jgi:hypothetical protein
VLAAVGFDDQACLGPEEVDLVAEQGDVGERERKRVLAADLPDQVLEEAADVGEGRWAVPEELAEVAAALAVGCSVDECLQPMLVQQVQALG